MTTIASPSYYSAAARYTAAKTGSAGSGDAQSGDAGVASANAEGRHTGVQGRLATAGFLGRLSELLLTSGVKPIEVSELPEDQYRQWMEMDLHGIEANRKYLESKYTERSFPDLPDYSNDPRMKNYATITIGGKVVATIDNQGSVWTESGPLGHRITELLKASADDEARLPGGPATAQYRAEKIAELLGGRIVTASTAMTQSQYRPMPSFEGVTLKVDYEGMKNDPLYEHIQSLEARYAATEQKRADYLAGQNAISA